MNQTIYDLADSGGSVRIVVQKKLDGTFIMGISNGKDKPLICQGEREKVDQEFEEQLPGFLQKVKTAAIEAKLRAAAEPETTPQISPTTSLHMELTRSALRSKRIDSCAPGTFLDAIE